MVIAQLFLLESSWSELFLITATQIGLSLEGATSLLSEASDERWSTSDVRQMALIQRELQSLCLDNTEFALLKAAVLFNPPCEFLMFLNRLTVIISR